MRLKLSCPSKTFLIGEYGALEGRPALIVNTNPRFELILEKTGETSIKIFHPESPAGRWMRERAPLLEGWRMQFNDPHKGRGGFGASSAQFLMSHCATTFLQISADKVREGFDMHAVWNDFQVLSENASGYDVLAQSVGGVAHVESKNWILQNLSWKFPELSFVIVRTGDKTPTHRHLQKVDVGSFSELGMISAEACRAYEEADLAAFVLASQRFSQMLADRDLLAPKTQKIIAEARLQLDLTLARGCGAFGADTVLFLFRNELAEKVLSFLADQRLEVIAKNQDLSSGLEVDWSWNKE